MTDQELETMVDRLIDHAKVCPHHAEQLDHIFEIVGSEAAETTFDNSVTNGLH